MTTANFCKPDGIYLLSHSVGLLPTTTKTWAQQHLLEAWATNPAEAWSSWMGEIDTFRSALASLLGTTANWVCPQANVSSGATKVLHALPVRPTRPTILLSEEAFPSLGFVCAQAQRVGYQLKFIGSDEDTQDPAVWAQHMTADVGVVLITQVHSNAGTLLPAAAIAGIAQQREVWSIVDIAQSVGVIPISVEELNADFVVGSCVKWLCGGPGAGFLWMRPAMLEQCQPLDVGWFSHQDPFAFDIHDFRYADSALRFWGGTPSVQPFAIAARSIQTMTAIGIDAVRGHNVALSDQLIGALDPALVACPADPKLRSGTVIVDAGNRTGHLLTALEAASVQVDQRATGLRISPHIYNDAVEVATVVAIITANT